MDGSPEKAKSSAAQPNNPSVDLATLDDEALLQTRICDLKLKIAGTELESRIDKFYAELDARGIALKPICYLGDEWFCPEGGVTIAIPFYLAHPRLKRLEAKMMMEVEGDTEAWCLRLLRHEMGHVINHAYLLNKDKRWQKLFGPPSLEYSESFRARPYSKRFVRHLEGYYAQSHPEEDFAETFAIWLTPDLDWRQQYRDWKALEKLEYVDKLMQELAGKPPLDIFQDQNQRRGAAALPPRRPLPEAAPYLRSGVSRFLRRRSAQTIRRRHGSAGQRAGRGILAPFQQVDSQCRLRMDRRAQVYHQPLAARR